MNLATLLKIAKPLLMKKLIEEITSDSEPDKKITKEKEVVSKKKACGWLTLILLAVIGFAEQAGYISEETADKAESAIESDIGTSIIEKIEDNIEKKD